MEARLSRYDEDIEALRRDMSKLEQELSESRERCRTMDSLVETLRAEREAEHRDREQWVKVLEERERKVEILEAQMGEVERERVWLAGERERLGGVVGGVEKARRSLEAEGVNGADGSETPFMTPSTEIPSALGFRTGQSLQGTPGADDESGKLNVFHGNQVGGGLSNNTDQGEMLEELRKKHAMTLEELNAVNARYQDALHDISDLYAQINEVKLQNGAVGDKASGGDVNGADVNESQTEGNITPPETNDIAPTESNGVPRGPPIPTQRRRGSRAATGLDSPSASARRLFFRQAASTESLHARSQLQSLSLSQELSSARSPKTSWSASESYNQQGLGDGLTPRGVGHRPQLSLQLPSERSADDLEKEIKSLQSVSTCFLWGPCELMGCIDFENARGGDCCAGNHDQGIRARRVV
jgi:hypothetical protein